MPEFNSHLDFFELLNVIRCGRNSAYETGLTTSSVQHFDEISSVHEQRVRCASVHLFSGVQLQLTLDTLPTI